MSKMLGILAFQNGIQVWCHFRVSSTFFIQRSRFSKFAPTFSLTLHSELRKLSDFILALLESVKDSLSHFNLSHNWE